MTKAILVDDAPSNLRTLEGLLNEYCPEIQVIETCGTIADAVKAIKTHNPDLIFLDVELQNELGFNLFDIFPSPAFEVIFTTAHEKYALQAIKSSCLEYLLKPIDYRELIKAVEKFEKQNQLTINEKKIEILLENVNNVQQTVNKIAIPNANGYVFLNTDEILYAEADMNYTKVITNKHDSYLSTKNLKEFEEMLDPNIFFRCHKSWLINLNYIKQYSRSDGTRVQMQNDQWIDISVRKKDEFLKLFRRL
jgi:two-component system LytT family response regulator